VNQREITLVGSVGTGVLGSGGVALSDYNTLEAERALLAGMQVQGRQKLFTRWDRYLNAYLSEFDFKFHQDGGLYRYADWTLKFLADDPRYYGQYSANSASGFLSAGVTSFSAHHNGNVPSFPVFTFTGTLSGCSAPLVGVSAGAASLSLKFSKLSLASGETLTVICDPRPEYRNVAAIYNNISNVKFNALQYINGPADLVNTLDYTQFFPFVPPGVAAQSLTVGCSGYMNYSVAWLDTWL
ncbi:MAG: hypothetical protein ACREQ5_12685, partial [Candidatus Dormibacteria bacterium]